ncbi:DNA polymerase [Lysinibacillus xylanilyticus]|uniref:DNA polymerase n=1 Tax=Lysinibacillus xylanilyticus TaxID=582475 RepID=UPI0036D7FAD8
MPLLGTVEYMQQSFVFMETAFTKGSRQLILVSEEDLEMEEQSIDRRRESYYRAGGVLLPDKYLIGILDPVRKKQYGSVQLLNLIYESINDVVRSAKLESTYTHDLGLDTYINKDSKVIMHGTAYRSIQIRTDKIKMNAELTGKLSIKPRSLAQKLTDIVKGGGRYNTSTFLDASLETLQRAGFDTSWVEGKDYIEIHSVEDWDNLLIPAFMEEYRRWDKERDFPYFLYSVDFESDGLNAYCEKHPDRHKAVYFSVSFKDHQSFGVFIDMENFENADREGIAQRLTYMTQMDVLEDRDLVFEHNGDKLEIKRSNITVIAHNMMIDRRFGMTMGADVWFNLCTLQLSFNMDPFMTTGINGLKHIVHKFFDIEYAELGDICGKKNKGMFKYLSDIRVIMMYGCADTDWHRLGAKRLITIAQEAKDYYGVDHAEQHMRLDALYMNHKADNDYQGMRVNLEAFRKEYEEKSRILNLYYSFMAQYVGKVKAYKDYETLALNAERFNVSLEAISGRDIAKAPPFRVEKWSGKEMLDVLFKVLGYPALVWTTQGKRAKLEGKAFKPKPAINTDALKYYMQFESSVSKEEIDKSIEEQKSLEDLKWFSMYLKEDYVDPKTGDVLIPKDKFNSYRLPFFYVLNKISPLIKSITAELKPVVEANSEYKFTHCNMSSAVTRRDLNPAQTVSKKSKYNYIPYDDDYYYCAVDQSAVEIRILYGLSKDEKLILPLNNPEKDSHTETAAMMHQKPAYTITKDVRKGIKFLAFGRPYGKEVFSSCKDFFGDNSPEHMAEMAYLFELYDNKLASVMAVLNKVRDEMDNPVHPPQSLVEYLEFDEEKEYGRMINAFGYCQHLEIRRDQEWFRQALRRKAGNFIIQGFASNLLRMIYLRMLKAFWAKGWIQDRRVRVHLTVHDEVDMSYHKSLNPVEVMSILHEALTVKMPGFPTFFVGINFGASWGQAKQDESELPVLLVDELNKEFKAGKYDNYDFGDHLEFFDAKRADYYNRRVHKELVKINEDRNVWDISFLNDAFTNYTVRSLLPEVAGNPVLTLPKGCEDPILLLTAFLPKFIAKYMLDKDNRKHHLYYKGKAIQITKDLLDAQFETIEDLFDSKPIAKSKTVASFVIDTNSDFTEDLMADIDLDEMGFDFDEQPIDQDEYETDGIENFNSGFLLKYSDFKTAKEEFKEYGSIEARVQAETEESKEKVLQFENFKVRNGKIILPIAQVKDYTAVVKFCAGNTSSSGSTLQLYIRHGNRLNGAGRYTVEFLRTLDEFLTTALV